MNLLDGDSERSRQIQKLLMNLIVANVAMVLLESMKGVRSFLGQGLFDFFEFFSVIIFTGEYLARLYGAPENPRFGRSRAKFVFSFLGLIDLLTVLPWWMEGVCRVFGLHFTSSGFRVFRMFRVLQLEHFVGGWALLGSVWRESRDSLKATGLLALIVWLLGACLFYEFESSRENTAFDSIPSSMYYTAIFLGGEWAICDFSPAGKCLCVFMCVAGIGLFSLPVGSVFEAFGDVLDELKEDEEREAKATAAPPKA